MYSVNVIRENNWKKKTSELVKGGEIIQQSFLCEHVSIVTLKITIQLTFVLHKEHHRHKRLFGERCMYENDKHMISPLAIHKAKVEEI